jgi:hypothetical protein
MSTTRDGSLVTFAQSWRRCGRSQPLHRTYLNAQWKETRVIVAPTRQAAREKKTTEARLKNHRPPSWSATWYELDKVYLWGCEDLQKALSHGEWKTPWSASEPVPAIRSPILRKTSSSPHPASDNDMAVVLTVSTARTESTVSHVTNFNKLITDRPFWEKLSANPTVQTISYAEAGASSSYTWPCQCQYCRRDLWRSLSSLNNVIREITELCIRFTVLMEMFGNSRCICVPVYMFNVWSIMTVSYRRVLYERLPMMPRPCQYGDYLAQYLTKFLVF